MNLLANLIRFATIAGALAGVAGILLVTRLQGERQMPPPGEPPVPPPAKPFARAVAATGILEALSENVAIGVPSPGLVTAVLTKVNDPVTKDQILFRLDDRDLRAEETTAKSRIAVDQAEIAVSAAQLAKVESQLARLTAVTDPRAVSRDDLENRRQDVAVAKAQLAAAKAQLEASQAALESIALRIARLDVRAPRAGTLLQVNIREGEYASTTPKAPAMILGDLDRLQIRADVDEQNATRIRPGQKARAHLKGDPTVSFDLTFVRVEPFVIPKVSLTGAATERIDTRVLQVIFSLERPASPPLYVGQQVDVFIEEN